MIRKSMLATALGIAVLVSGYSSAPQVLFADSAEPERPASAYTVVVNGSKLALDTQARIAGSTMLVPARNIAEALGAVVTYDELTQAVTAVKGDVSVTLWIGKRDAVKNGAPYTLDTAPVRDNGVTMVPLRFFSETFGTVVRWEGESGKVHIDHEANLLPTVGTYDNLKELLKNAAETQPYDGRLELFGKVGATVDVIPAAPAAAAKSAAVMEAKDASASNSGSADHSTTNVQVEGVDEADVVKTDGEYIYQVNRERVLITRAYPAGELSLVSTIALGDRKLQPLELYVDGDRLIVIGTAYADLAIDSPSIKPLDTLMKKRIIRPHQNTTVKTVIYDISSRANPKAVKEVETEGSYVTSRKVGQDLYVIANQYVNRYYIMNGESESKPPVYRDSTISAEYVSPGYDSIRYFPDTVLDSYMMVAGINTAQPERKAHVSVYLGSAQNVYASSKNLYVSLTRNKMTPKVVQNGDTSSSSVDQPIQEFAAVNHEQNSMIYKFLMEQGEVRFTAKGEVPGTVLNQFSMDEHNGYFRIATTKGDTWRSDEQTSKNNLYVLDESMKIAGKIEDIAPGERIYSVRFMGGRGYMVTFKKVDPLFVLDLADPTNPTILGKLKIPGYSDYMHPYDETHLIGFGKDAVEEVNEWEKRQGVSSPSTTAFYQGIKVAMFDVSDVANPKELFKTAIGDRGTDSELLRNHKALLFSKEKNLMAFPVTVMKVDPKTKQEQGASAYGQFAYQGAFVYRVDLNEGFTLRGTISHLTDEELKKAGSEWYNSDRNVERALYIGDTLYTLSQSQIRANDLDSLKERKRITLP